MTIPGGRRESLQNLRPSLAHGVVLLPNPVSPLRTGAPVVTIPRPFKPKPPPPPPPGGCVCGKGKVGGLLCWPCFQVYDDSRLTSPVHPPTR